VPAKDKVITMKIDKNQKTVILPVVDPVTEYMLRYQRRMLDGTALQTMSPAAQQKAAAEAVHLIHDLLARHNLVALA
jgi:hypothetical protein